jgi:hypothetical protein
MVLSTQLTIDIVGLLLSILFKYTINPYKTKFKNRNNSAFLS